MHIYARVQERQRASRPSHGPPEPPFDPRPGEIAIHSTTSAYGGFATLTLTDQRLFVQTKGSPKVYGDRYSIELSSLERVSISRRLPDGWSLLWLVLTRKRGHPKRLLLHFKGGRHRLIAVWRLEEWAPVIEAELKKARTHSPGPLRWACGCSRGPDPE